MIINGHQNAGQNILGMLVKDILFKSGKSAFVICGKVTISGIVTTVSSLLALVDGGFQAQETRKAVVSFVSIMNYLVENRLVYLMEHEQTPNQALFYQESGSFLINLSKTDSRQKGQRTVNTYSENIGNGEILTIEESVAYGYSASIDCKGITLNDGNVLGDVGISNKVKNEMLRYLTSHVYPTLALSELVRNNFKTPEELSSEKSLYLASQQVDRAQKTLIVAIMTLLASFVIPFLNSFGLCKCIIVIVIMVFSFVMGYTIKSDSSKITRKLAINIGDEAI